MPEAEGYHPFQVLTLQYAALALVGIHVATVLLLALLDPGGFPFGHGLLIDPWRAVTFVELFVVIGAYILVRKGNLRTGAWLLVLSITLTVWLIEALMAYGAAMRGERDIAISYPYYLFPIAVSLLLLRWRHATWLVAANLVVLFAVPGLIRGGYSQEFTSVPVLFVMMVPVLLVGAWLTEHFLEDLSRQRARAERLRKEIETTGFSVAHHLQEPVRDILLRSDEAVRAALANAKERELEALREVHDSGTRLRGVLDGFVRLTEVHTGRLQLGPVSIVDVIAEASQGMAVPVTYPEGRGQGPKVTVWGDPAALRRLFHNLFAFIAQQDQGLSEIRVRIDSDARGTLVVVEDRNLPIPPDAREAAFQPFGRWASGQEATDVGVALAVVRKIALAHGGNAWLEETTAGNGNLFHVFLPRQR